MHSNVSAAQEPPLGPSTSSSSSGASPDRGSTVRPATVQRVIQAALFMSPNLLSIGQLMELLGETDYSKVKSMALDAMDAFNESNHGIEIYQDLDRFGMRVRTEFNAHVKALGSAPLFNEGVMKTLALVAFKQPIYQSTVIEYRNNAAYEHIHTLLENGFLSREAKGRTYVLKTTQKFYDYFGKDAFAKSEAPMATP